MSQVTYEIIRKLFEIYPIILQTVLFLVLWNVFFRWEKGIWIVAGILAVMNICMGLWLENPGVIRYTMSAVIVLGYCFCKYQKHLEKAVFILLLFYNFHALSYLIADSIYQCTVESIFRGLDVLSEESIGRILENPSYLGTEYYPQLIGEELFERVQRRREKVRAELGRADHRSGRDERILFGGVIWCAECGAVCSHIQPNHKKERGGTAKWKCKSYVIGRAKNCRNSFITDGQAKQVCVEAINAVIRNKGLLRVQRQEEKVSPQYRVLERNLQRMKEEQERTETDLMKLLYERAEERYRTLEVRDGEFRTEEVKNILAGKKELETFDENLYRKIIARIWVHGGNMAEVELINGSRVTAGYKD